MQRWKVVKMQSQSKPLQKRRHQFLVAFSALTPEPDVASNSLWRQCHSSNRWRLVLYQPYFSFLLQSIELVKKAPDTACIFSPYNIRERKTFSKRCVGRLTLSVIKIKESRSSETASIDTSFAFLFTNRCLYATDSFKNKQTREKQKMKTY